MSDSSSLHTPREFINNARLGYSVAEPSLRHLGSIYTPPDIANYLVSWAIQDKNSSVLDLGVGNGAFVWAAYRRLLELGDFPKDAQEQIFGAEVFKPAFDNFVSSAASKDLSFTNIRFGNFLSMEFPPVDVVVGNPPYVRRQYLEGVDELRQDIAGVDKMVKNINKLSRLADLYMYFLLKAGDLLRVNGRLAVITADSWLSARYGEILREILLSNFEVDQLVRFDRQIFEAEVKTVILLATKKSVVNRNRTVHFLRVRNGTETADLLRPIKDLRENDTLQVRNVKQYSLTSDKRWSDYFIDKNVASVISSHSLMGRVAEQFKTRIGIQTLAKDFFVLTKDKIDEWQIERQYLKPLLQSIRFLQETVVEADSKVEHFLFYCNNPKEDLAGTNALRYIEFGEDALVKVRGKNKTVKGYHNKERIQRDGRKYWYDLKTEIENRNCAEILVPRLISKTLNVIWNRAGYVPGELFIEFHLSPQKIADTEVYLAVLSSVVSEILIRMQAQLYGGGAFNVSPKHIKTMPIIDVTKLRQDQKEELKRVFKLFSVNNSERQQLDDAVFDILKLPPRHRSQLRDIANDMRSQASKDSTQKF